MTISRINIFEFDGRNHLHQSLSNQSDPEVISFKEILHKTAQHKTDGYINEILPLSKDKLMNIINNMNAHMDTKLIQALSMEANGEMDVPSSMYLKDRLQVPQTQVGSNTSNKWHSSLKNDIPDGGTNLDRIITQAAKTHDIEEYLTERSDGINATHAGNGSRTGSQKCV
jgi:hypothetical protein